MTGMYVSGDDQGRVAQAARELESADVREPVDDLLLQLMGHVASTYGVSVTLSVYPTAPDEDESESTTEMGSD